MTEALKSKPGHEEHMSICSFNDLATLEVETAVVKEKVSNYSEDGPTTTCGKIKEFVRILPRGATPPNWRVVSLVWFSMLASAFSITFLFPFLPEMIVDFGYSEEEKGYYVGLVASSMFAGRAFGSYFWGWLCDKIGRKPVFIMCTLSTGITTFVFGFSTNVMFAIALRLVTGLLNGTIVVAKVILYEVSDSTNQALGMSSLAMAFGVGIVLGPAIGGYLANPVLKYPSVFGGSTFLRKYPYILPGIVPLVIAVSASVVIFFILPETKGIQMKEQMSEEVEESSEANVQENEALLDRGARPNLMEEAAAKANEDDAASNIEKCERRCLKRQISAEQDSELMRARVNSLSLYQSGLSVSKSYRSLALPEPERKAVSKRAGCCQLDIVTLLKDRDVVLVVWVYTLFSFGLIGYDDLFTIWASTKHYLGGLGFSSSQIGTAVGAMAIPMMLLQVYIFPKVEARFGCKKTFQFSAMASMVIVQGIVLLRFLHNRPGPLWFGLFMFVVPLRILGICCMSASSVMINNSVPPHLAGAVNGLAMTSTAVARAFAPTAAGSMFAWSITEGEVIGPPFDVSFSFFIMGFSFFVCVILNILLPQSLDVQALKNLSVHADEEEEEKQDTKTRLA